MENIAWFKELSKTSILVAGGKGAQLGEMYNINLPVPPGFVVTANAYKKFLKTSELEEPIYKILDNLDVEDTDALQKAAESIQDIIINSEMPRDIRSDIMEAYDNLNVDIDVYKMASKAALDIIKAGRDLPYVAVRSSATAEDMPQASFAGQMATFLNIKGNEDIVKTVQKCWASLFTSRAIYYRIKNNFKHRDVAIAVIVQRMVNSEKSGIIFTANPSTNNQNEIIIEAGLGLGEAVVSGSITPDLYIVDKETSEIKERKINKQEFSIIRDSRLGRSVKRTLRGDEGSEQKIDDITIKKLARYAKQIEEHYRAPQDIEFAIESNKIYIVQSRPITTLKKLPSREETPTTEVQQETSIEKIETEETTESSGEKELLLQGLSASPGIGSGPVKLVHAIEDLSKIQKGNVLVARMTNPDYVAAMERASAIVTDEGGVTCHAAIVSREMGIPCVVGTMKATHTLTENELITVDGTEGKVYKGLAAIQHKEPKPVPQEIREEIETVTEVKVIVDLPDYAERAATTGADGVGLLRCEFMILKNKEHPVYLIDHGRKEELVNQLSADIKKIASAFKGKPVWYRTLDAPTDEFRHLEGGENEPEEDNPMMGWRSIRRGLDQPGLLKAEFEAIKKVHDEGFTNVGVMLPLVTDVEQIKRSKEILKDVGLEPCENIDFGVMVETPAAVQIIKEICEEGVDFISLGTNDLTQFTLAVDRNNAKVQKLYDEMHPAVLRQIKHVIKTCREYNVETSICGQAGSKPEMAEFLVKAGIDSITANADAVQQIKNMVARTERKLLLNAARGDIKL